jgi:hypothetical protein
MKRYIKSRLSKVKFALGLNPKILKNGDPQQFIPKGYESVLTITADFELAWAPRYNKSVADPYRFAIDLARRERENIPRILAVCEQHRIPLTWATVGHLFLESCSAAGMRKHPEIPVVAAYEGPYWNFPGGDWFEFDPCTGLRDDPEWYAPDLIDRILQAKTRHEIGCHTFSHIDCRDGVCPPDLFESELLRCKQLAAERNLALTSFVHPGHTIGNLDSLAGLGFTSFQTDPGNILGYPVRHKNGLWELQRTMEFYINPHWSVDYHIHRYKKIVDRAIDSRTVCNFWFHPSFNPVFVDEIMPSLLEYISAKNKKIWACTVHDYTGYLNSREWTEQ